MKNGNQLNDMKSRLDAFTNEGQEVNSFKKLTDKLYGCQSKADFTGWLEEVRGDSSLSFDEVEKLIELYREVKKSRLNQTTINTSLKDSTIENSTEITNESFNNQEFQEYMDLCAKLGIKTMGDVQKFSTEHNNVKDQELLQALRDEVNKKQECKEGCAHKHIKEEIHPERLEGCDANYYVGRYDGEDFMIVDSWEDIEAIQKCLDPDYEQGGRYDTSIIDEFMPWGFMDEYSVCDSCGNIIRTEPDSYSWVADYWLDRDNGAIYCEDCVKEDPTEYLHELVNNPQMANTILTDDELEDIGFVRMDGDYESGWYGKEDSPEEILNNLLEKYPEGIFIFSITAQGQFATNFEVWGEADSIIEEE